MKAKDFKELLEDAKDTKELESNEIFKSMTKQQQVQYITENVFALSTLKQKVLKKIKHEVAAV